MLDHRDAVERSDQASAAPLQFSEIAHLQAAMAMGIPATAVPNSEAAAWASLHAPVPTWKKVLVLMLILSAVVTPLLAFVAQHRLALNRTPARRPSAIPRTTPRPAPAPPTARPKSTARPWVRYPDKTGNRAPKVEAKKP